MYPAAFDTGQPHNCLTAYQHAISLTISENFLVLIKLILLNYSN